MKCNVKCPECETVHKINSRYCAECGYDLEPYILGFKSKHLPIHFDGGYYGNCCCGGPNCCYVYENPEQRRSRFMCESLCSIAQCLCCLASMADD